MRIIKKTYPDGGAEVTEWHIPDEEIRRFIFETADRCFLVIDHRNEKYPETLISLSSIRPPFKKAKAE